MEAVNKKLTRSSGHRADFNRRRKGANVQQKIDELPQLKALLSGHGICWGIRAESWERMWEARDVSDIDITCSIYDVVSANLCLLLSAH
jgi:hypothetical protein